MSSFVEKVRDWWGGKAVAIVDDISLGITIEWHWTARVARAVWSVLSNPKVYYSLATSALIITVIAALWRILRGQAA